MSEEADLIDPGSGPGSATAADPPLDLVAFQRSVEKAIGAVDDATGEPPAESVLIDRIAALESLRNSLAALQSATVYAFARAHVVAQVGSGTVEPERLERSIAAQIGPACGVSPIEGRKRVRVARDLRDGLDHVRGLFAAGRLSAYKAATVVTHTSYLDAAERAEVDRLLVGYEIGRLGVGKLRDRVRSVAALVAPEKFRARTTAARADRRVTLRPAPDGMTDLIAHLPVEQGVACLAALRKAVADASVSREPLTRSRGQLMADTLVERVTGQVTADHVAVEVQVVVPVEALVDPDSPLPAEIPGHGPVPVTLLTTTTGRKTWRRLVTSDGIVIGGDSSRRKFTGRLAALIRARDGHRCSEPFCDAPIREIDHIERSADGGRTEYVNGRGVCTFHNLVREMRGWHVERTPAGVRTTTPTGHTYLAEQHRYPGSSVRKRGTERAG